MCVLKGLILHDGTLTGHSDFDSHDSHNNNNNLLLLFIFLETKLTKSNQVSPKAVFSIQSPFPLVFLPSSLFFF